MAKRKKKNPGISELLVKNEARPIEYMLTEYKHEMEEIKKALGDETKKAKNAAVRKKKQTRP